MSMSYIATWQDKIRELETGHQLLAGSYLANQLLGLVDAENFLLGDREHLSRRRLMSAMRLAIKDTRPSEKHAPIFKRSSTRRGHG